MENDEEPSRTAAEVAFSIVIPTIGRADQVSVAVGDVLDQSHLAFELIVVVDGRDPETQEALASMEDERLSVIQIEPSGPGGARNAGARVANGDWLGFLDDDDRVDDDWLDVFVGLAVQPATGMVRCGALIANAESLPMRQTEVGTVGRARPNHGISGTFAVRRDVFDGVGGYDPALRYGENTELCLRLVHECERRDLAVRETDRTPMTFVIRDRGPDSPALRLTSALHVLEADAEVLQSHPEYRANLWGIAGVNAARLGDMRAARRYLLRSALAHPRRLQRWARVLVACTPGLPGRRWVDSGPDEGD